MICNQAAGFNRCLVKVQQDMQSQLKAIRVENKGKSAPKLSAATEELQFLMAFNSSICHAMANSMEHLTDFVFVNMANLTLIRRDSYLSYLKAGIKAYTLAALRTASLHLSTLFPDSVIKQGEEDITRVGQDLCTRRVGITPMRGRIRGRITESRTDQYGRTSLHMVRVEGARGNISFYCVNTSYPMDNCFTGQYDRSHQSPEKDVQYILPAGPVRVCIR